MQYQRYNKVEHRLRRSARVLDKLAVSLLLGTGWYVWFVFDSLITNATGLVVLIGCSLCFAGTCFGKGVNIQLWLRMYTERTTALRAIYRLTSPGRRNLL